MGTLAAQCQPDWLVYGSGDGPLGADSIEQICEFYPDMAIATLSFPNLSGRLKTRNSSLVADNALIGRDCLAPMDTMVACA